VSPSVILGIPDISFEAALKLKISKIIREILNIFILFNFYF
tara:strand:- start:725 stop:847 length:123 start_codon:yes stop_codon:yes gene_type:complete